MGFFQSARGRTFLYITVRAVTLGLFLGNVLPHTLAVRQYIEAAQCYNRDRSSRELPDRIRKRFHHALDILGYTETERKLVKPFIVFGFDLIEVGSTKYRTGAALGIPGNYAFTSTNDINCYDRGLRGENIHWDSILGKQLQDSIVLTEDEQLFGLCRSLLQLRSHHCLFHSIYPSVSFLTAYSLGRYLNRRYNLLARPLILRLFMYTLLAYFGVVLCILLQNINQLARDISVNMKLAALGPQFIDAGGRYYEKLLLKNHALRRLIGDVVFTGCCSS